MKKNLYTIMVCILAVGLISGCSKTFNKTFDSSSKDAAWSVQQTKDGGYILAGTTGWIMAGSTDVWLIKTDAYGNKVWETTFGGSNYDEARAVQQTNDGGYILAGMTESFGAGGDDVWLIKTDANGNEVWDKTFGGIFDQWARAMQQTSDGGYILAGYTDIGADYWDAWLIKTDADGNKVWEKTFGGSDKDMAYAVQQTSDGGYILAAGSNGDAWLIKTDAKGNAPATPTPG